MSVSSASMPPPARIPARPVSNPPQSGDSSSRATPVVAPTRPSNLGSNVPHSSSGASAIAIPARDASRPTVPPPQVVTDVTRTTQPVSPSGGIAISTPSRAVPIITSREPQPIYHSAHAPSGSKGTGRTGDTPHPPSIQAPSSASNDGTMSSTVHPGPFDLSQIDPSLQPTLVNIPLHGVTSSFEGSSGTPIVSVPTGTTGESSRDPATQREGTSSIANGDVSQGRPKRRRTKSSQDAGPSPDGSPKKRRSRRGSSTQPGAEGGESQTTTLGPKRRGKSRAPSVPPFDPDADPGEDLDPTTVTMAALCDDTGQGRVSSKAAQVISNHAAWRAASKEKRARLRAIAEAKKYGRNIEDDDQTPAANGGDRTAASEATPSQEIPSASRSPSAAPQAGPSTSSTERPAREGTAGDDFDYSQDLSTSRYNVQVRIGANGETIIDEESLFVNRDEEDDTQNYTHVEESDTTKFVNSLTYSKKTRGSRWSAEETDLFFDVSRPSSPLYIY